MFYTALIVDQVVRPVKAAFEKEYPFIQLEFFRANSDRLAQKILAEYQAKRYDVDVISGSGATTMGRQAGYMQKFFSPHTAEYPAELKDPQGFWGATNVYFMTLGYNSRMVKPSIAVRWFIRFKLVFLQLLIGRTHQNHEPRLIRQSLGTYRIR